MMLLIIFFTFHPSSVHWALSTQSSDPGLWINIGYCFFPFKYRYVFFLFFLHSRQNLDASLFCVSVLFLHLYPADISHSYQRLISASYPCVWDWRQRRCEGACVSCSFSTSAASGQVQTALQLSATRCRCSRVSQEEPDKRWRFHINLSERMSAAGIVRQEHICHICLHLCDNNPEMNRWEMAVIPWIF